jgi:hypothetical protein
MTIEVTVHDTETGETETKTLDDDWLLITAGKVYLAHTQAYLSTGTTVLTIKEDA